MILTKYVWFVRQAVLLWEWGPLGYASKNHFYIWFQYLKCTPTFVEFIAIPNSKYTIWIRHLDEMKKIRIHSHLLARDWLLLQYLQTQYSISSPKTIWKNTRPRHHPHIHNKHLASKKELHGVCTFVSFQSSKSQNGSKFKITCNKIFKKVVGDMTLKGTEKITFFFNINP